MQTAKIEVMNEMKQ